jgi:beta-lactamase regulating signal transducer with metallopeptidase domain
LPRPNPRSSRRLPPRALSPAPGAPALRLYPAQILLALWLCGSWLCVARLALAAHRLRRLRAIAYPPDPALEQAFAAACETRRVRASLRVLPAAYPASGPFLCGLSRPTVMLPTPMTHAAQRSDLPIVFAHELQHVAARDLIWLAIAQIAQSLLWFHPLAWPLRRALTAASEEACDAAARNSLPEPELYAPALARIALQAHASRPAWAIASAGLLMARMPAVRNRLQRLALNRPTAPLGRTRLAFCLALAASLFTLLATARLTAAEPDSADSDANSAQVIRAYYFPTTFDKSNPASLADIPKGCQMTYLTKYILLITAPSAQLDQFEASQSRDHFKPFTLAVYSLNPDRFHDLSSGASARDQIDVFAGRVAAAVNTFLQSDPSHSADQTYIHLSEASLQLVVIAPSALAARVEDYIRALPELQHANQRIIPLRGANADHVAEKLTSQLKQSNQSRLKLSLGDQRTPTEFPGLTLEALSFAVNNVYDLKDDSVRLRVTQDGSAQELELAELIPATIGEYSLYAENIRVDQTGPAGSAALRVERLDSPAKPRQVVIEPIPQLNALNIAYRAEKLPHDFIERLSQIESGQKQIEIEIQYVELTAKENFTPDQIESLAQLDRSTYRDMHSGRAALDRYGTTQLTHGPKVLTFVDQEANFMTQINDYPAQSMMKGVYVRCTPEILDDNSIHFAAICEPTWVSDQTEKSMRLNTARKVPDGQTLITELTGLAPDRRGYLLWSFSVIKPEPTPKSSSTAGGAVSAGGALRSSKTP